MNIKIPKEVHFILGQLNKQGHEAYVVGGCVRDSLLEKEPQDWDITTSALPEQVKGIFSKTVDTGLEHGTVTVIRGRKSFEVTTYRIDGTYVDNRHPSSVMFTSNLAEDLRRRDFTINAMAYHPSLGLVDPFDGRGDIHKRTIRCVGNAKARFSEDALRVLRALRFCAQLDFSIDYYTKTALKRRVSDLKEISKERVYSEITKILTSEHPEVFRKLVEYGITKLFIPEFDELMKEKVQETNLGEQVFEMLKIVSPDKALRYAVVFFSLGKPARKQLSVDGEVIFPFYEKVSESYARKILKDLTMDNNTLNKVLLFLRFHNYPLKNNDYEIRKCLHQFGKPELFGLLLQFQEAYIYTDPLMPTAISKERALTEHKKIKQLYKEILLCKDCLHLQDLAIKGTDLLERGFRPGKEIGMHLEKALDFVLSNPNANTKEELLNYLGIE
ncbi:polynucleotide adenylyltransferase [Clostridia bacterium]|nr:polynucleotide adenylyltransferase [Clostridia bacterium]